MKRYVLLVIAILFLFIGCAIRHYCTVEEDAVRMCLRKPDAKAVYFASSLDGFKPVMAKQNSDETWEVTVPKDVEFRYFYIVDGDVYVPLCAFKEHDDFGSENCIYVPRM
jgi:hypothetical protein